MVVHIAIQELFTGSVLSPLCALFVARPTSAVEDSSRYMTFRQVHRSGEHWNFLIIVFIAAEPCKFETAPAPSRENYPGSGSGSGSEQNVPAAPAPAPDKVCRFRRLRLRIPATLPSRNCLPAVSSLCAVFVAQPTSVGHSSTYNRSGKHWYFLINVLHRHPGIVYRQRSPSVPCSWPGQHLSNTVRRITAPVSIGIF